MRRLGHSSVIPGDGLDWRCHFQHHQPNTLLAGLRAAWHSWILSTVVSRPILNFRKWKQNIHEGEHVTALNTVGCVRLLARNGSDKHPYIPMCVYASLESFLRTSEKVVLPGYKPRSTHTSYGNNINSMLECSLYKLCDIISVKA